jgi:hypothetical protein
MKMIKIALLTTALLLPSLAAAQVSKCTLQLNVQVTPDVENPRDPGFLSTLAGNPAYSLIFVRTSDEGDAEVLQLSGPPGTCHSQVEIMKMNSHIINIEVMGDSGEDTTT